MKIWHYTVFYLVLTILCISQLVVVLGRSGQNFNASAQLSYLQKHKLQLQQEINHSVVTQAQEVAMTRLMEGDDIKSQYQPITHVLAIKDTETQVISLNTTRP